MGNGFVLTLFSKASKEAVTMAKDDFLRLYCSQYQPIHREESETADAMTTANICVRYKLPDGSTYACDWDQYFS